MTFKNKITLTLRFLFVFLTLCLGLGRAYAQQSFSQDIGFGGTAASESASESTNVVDLALAVTVSSNAVPLGDQLSYSINVANLGTNAASNVTIVDSLPASMNYVYAVANQGAIAVSGNNVTCSLGTLPPGATVSVKIYVKAQNVGTFTNFVTLSQKEFNVNETENPSYQNVDVYLPAPPIIDLQPVTQLLNLGGILNLVVGASGPPPLKYQWRLNGANIPGATNAVYTVLGVLSKHCGTYTVVVSDEYGAVVSEPALVSLQGLLNLPASDSFAGRGLSLNLLNLVSMNNQNATSEPGEPLHAGIPGGKSVWFTWTPLLSGIATFTTEGSSFDTLLAVYTGNNLTNLTRVAANDDDGSFYTSKVVFYANAGTTYSIAVDGAYGAYGKIILNFSQELTGQKLPRITQHPADKIVAFGDTAQFSVQTIEAGLNYQWYFNDATIPGATTTSLVVTNVSMAKVGLYKVRVSTPYRNVVSLPASLQINVLDGIVNTNGSAQDKFQSTVSHISALYGAPQQSSVDAPNNTMMTRSSTSTTASRTATASKAGGTSRGYTSTQVFSTYGGGTQTGEPNGCGTPGGSSAWTSVQAVDNGILTIDTIGSNFRTILAVYTGNGNDFSSLTQVACSVGRDSGTNNSRVSFAATSNTVYYIAVDGVNGAYGTVVLNCSLTVPPTITQQPASRTVSPGATVTLAVEANGYPAPSCQWWFNGTLMIGVTNKTLTITNFEASKAGTFQMTVSNNVGSTCTAPADLLLGSVMRFDSSSKAGPGQCFQMRVVGPANTTYIVQASTNLLNWVSLATNSSPNGIWYFTDQQSTYIPNRYYRTIPAP